MLFGFLEIVGFEVSLVDSQTELQLAPVSIVENVNPMAPSSQSAVIVQSSRDCHTGACVEWYSTFVLHW